MDTRNYNEPFNCGLEKCDCSDDDSCGCTFPNNVSDYSCNAADGNCGGLKEKASKPQKKETVTHIVKDSICTCTPDECSCAVERTETDK